ncbi:hypothetical protein LX36DRAFT_498318 [Colletotrichum falcatum]|nr:hypothetical protein LX36DRAFT_498318 [Colletotrichum falcatum]
MKLRQPLPTVFALCLSNPLQKSTNLFRPYGSRIHIPHVAPSSACSVDSPPSAIISCSILSGRERGIRAHIQVI